MILRSHRKMKFFPIFVLLLISAASVKAQFVDCRFTSEGIEIPTITKLPTDDDAAGFIWDLISENVRDAKILPNSNNYIALKFMATDNTFKVSLTDAYGNMEQDLPSKSETTEIRFEFEITCESGVVNSLFLDLLINDKNNQPTELSSEDISYKIPLPLPAKVPLYLFSDTPGENKLTARDADITNVLITFKIEPDNIFEIIGALDARDPLGKTHVATISAIRPLTTLDVHDFTITAQDNDAGTPTTKVISITVDEAASLPPPLAFGEKYYEGKYEISETGEHSLQIDPLGLTNVGSNTFKTTLDQGEIGDFFGAIEDGETVVLSKKTDLTPEILKDHDYLTLWVEAKYENFDIPSTSVSVVITLPPKEQSGQQAFTEALYSAVYDADTPAVDLDVPIIVNNLPDLSFALEGALADKFGVQPNAADPLSLEISIITPLLPEEINNNDYLLLTITAKTSDGNLVDSTALLIDLPDETDCTVTQSVFSNTLYKGVYNVPPEGAHTITITDVISVDNTVAVTVVIEPDEFPGHFVVNNEDPTKIEITLVANLSDDVLAGNEVISLVLVAKSTDNTVYGSAVVIIDLPPPEECPVPTENAFDQSLYVGEYAINGDVTFTQPIKATASEPLQIDLSGGEFDEYFIVNYDDLQDVKINTNAPIPEAVVEANKFMTLVLSAKSGDKDYGEAVVVIKMPSVTTPTENVFGETMYKGEYSISTEGDHNVEFEGTITATSGDPLELKFDTAEFEPYFAIDVSGLPNVLITVVAPGLTEEILKKPFITLLLNAKSADGTIDYGQTGLVISLPEPICEVEPSDQIFTQTVYDGEYKVPETGNHEVSTNEISIITEDAVVTVAGDYADNFKAIINGKIVTLTIETELTEDILIENRYISILLQGTSGDLTGAARIILALPEPECNVPSPGIKFDDVAYKLPADHTGAIGVLVATFEPPEDHTFTISGHPSSVELTPPNQLTVPANSQLIPGTIRFTATVTGNVNPEKTKDAVVTIYVLPNIDEAVRTAFSMQVTEVRENLAATEILPLPDVGPIETIMYNYVILKQEPESDPKMFDIDRTTNYLTSIQIDREDAIFEGMRVPQVLLTIGLEAKVPEPDTTNKNSLLAIHPLFKHMFRREKRNAQDYKQCLMLDKEINRVDSIMHVPVIIIDENDNKPIFTQTSIVVGYPTKDNVVHINPPYLLKAEATDKDEGDFAVIKYGCVSTSVNINENTGVVYPTEGLYNAGQKTTLTITATDGLNEAEIPLTATVILLDKDHMSVLGFANVQLEDLETKLAELSTDGVSLRSLSAGSLPVSSSTTLRADTDFYLKTIVYGIKDNEAMTHESLKAFLNNKPVTIIEYTPPGTTGPGTGNGGNEECDDTGLIAGISVLAVALGVCIIGFVVFYFKKKNNNASLDLEQLPEHKTSFKKQNGFEPDNGLKDVATRRATQYPMEVPKIDPDSSSNSSTASEEGEDFDEARDRRKSVTFNEETQHFDITAKENETDSAKVDVTVNEES